MNVEQRINKLIDDFNGNVSLYIKDEKGNIIKHNENDICETASCIKLFILIEYYNQILNNKISRDDLICYSSKDDYVPNGSGIIQYLDDLKLSSKNVATLMMIVSDNIATNMMIEYLGFDNINKTIKDLGFKKTALSAKKLDFDIYNSVGQTTAYEYAKAYEMLYNKKILNPELCDELIKLLSHQRLNVMLKKFLSVKNLECINFIASKSGSLGDEEKEDMVNCRNDGGIISTNFGDYIISIFIRDFNDYRYYNDNEGTILGGKISKLIFDSFIKNKGSIK